MRGMFDERVLSWQHRLDDIHFNSGVHVSSIN